MKERIEQLQEKINQVKIDSKETLEQFRIQWLSKKSELQDLLSGIKNVVPKERKSLGALINKLKEEAEEKFNNYKEKFKETAQTQQLPDSYLPGQPIQLGSRHPLNLVAVQINTIFQSLGFSLADGPEIEDDWHNFSSLNFPPEHPARDMQDTFFVDDEIALRTHTSSVQVRLMETQKPPMRYIMPGRVYRNEAISARANCFFHQAEGLYIDKKVSFADLKQVLFEFVRQMFGAECKNRFRPSYFPFTEPSAEMDISCFICGGKGCPVCKQSGWVEILGCGMVDPQVLSNSGHDPETYSGYAFGMGIERITMLKYSINDIRVFFDNDIRFLKQFI